jgi:hypothetical protein
MAANENTSPPGKLRAHRAIAKDIRYTGHVWACGPDAYEFVLARRAKPESCDIAAARE